MDRAAIDDSAVPVETNRADESRLDRIAALLGCPVESFSKGATGDSGFEAGALLRLWLAIPNDDDRAKVIDLARTLARS